MSDIDDLDDDKPLTDEGWYEHKCTCQSCGNVFAVRWHEDINDYVVSNCPACGQKYDEYALWVKQQQDYADDSIVFYRERRIICLCGSTKFKSQFEDVTLRESLKGNVVLSVAWFSHTDGELSPEQKIILGSLHRAKIDMADEVIVVNVGGYIGKSTAEEIEYAIDNGKLVTFLESEVGGAAAKEKNDGRTIWTMDKHI